MKTAERDIVPVSFGQVIDDDYIVAATEKSVNSVGADVSGSARDEYLCQTKIVTRR